MIVQTNDPERTIVVMRDGLLPFRSPEGRIGGYRLISEGSLTHLGSDKDAAADEAETAVVEIVALEIGNDGAETTRTHERIEYMSVVIEERHKGRRAVPRKVLADHPLARRRVVGPADARDQQQLGIGPRERGEEDDLRRLFDLPPLGIDVGDARRAVAGDVDPSNGRVRTDFKIASRQSNR